MFCGTQGGVGDIAMVCDDDSGDGVWAKPYSVGEGDDAEDQLLCGVGPYALPKRPVSL